MVRKKLAEKHGYKQIVITEYTRTKLKDLLNPLDASTYDEAIRKLIGVYENLEREKVRMLMCYEYPGAEYPLEEWIKHLRMKNLTSNGVVEALKYLKGDARKLTVNLEMCKEAEVKKNA
ncbi:MAG: hypothetical protein QW503_02245 [Sulfolobales archaeon]